MWRTMLVAMMGEPLTKDELVLFRKATGRAEPPKSRVEEAAFIVGRRGGKDRATSVLAAYIAALCDHSDVISPGERGVLICIGADQRQARIQRDYIEGAFRSSPVLARSVTGSTADALSLENGIDVEVRPASFRRLRGPTAVAVIASEAAFWMDSETGSVNADTEILAAARPMLATTGGPLVIITTPYARRGETWGIYRRHYGPAGDPLILVAQGATRDFNPTLPQKVVDRAYERDPAAAAAEYDAIFRTDVESFVAREAVEACVSVGVRERAPLPGVRYVGFVDPSGGSTDAMTLAVAHRDPAEGRAVLDALREVRPPFSPASVVADFAALLKSYRISKVTGDRYGGEFCREPFKRLGITYTPSARPKSDIYRDVLPLINSGRVSLLDNPRLVAQLTGLERRTARSGRDSITGQAGTMTSATRRTARCSRSAAGTTTPPRSRPRSAAASPLPT